MVDAATQKCLEVKEQYIRDAVDLKTLDRVPAVPNGPAWTGRAANRLLLEFRDGLGVGVHGSGKEGQRAKRRW